MENEFERDENIQDINANNGDEEATKEDTSFETAETKEQNLDNTEDGTNKEENQTDNANESSSSTTEDNNDRDDLNESDEQIKKLTEENNSLKEKYTRLLAEFENFRKRNEKERLSMIDMGASEVLVKLLPVIDNFDRAIESKNTLEKTEDEQNTDKKEENFTKGIEQIYKQLQKFLTDLDVKKIDALGKQFDPNLHNAVMTDEESDAEEGIITADLQQGYTYKDQILRHSMVKVKK